jgi:hypothetical protein
VEAERRKRQGEEETVCTGRRRETKLGCLSRRGDESGGGGSGSHLAERGSYEAKEKDGLQESESARRE